MTTHITLEKFVSNYEQHYGNLPQVASLRTLQDTFAHKATRQGDRPPSTGESAVIAVGCGFTPLRLPDGSLGFIQIINGDGPVIGQGSSE